MRPVCSTCAHSQQDHLVPFTPIKGKRYRCTEEGCSCQMFIAAPVEERPIAAGDAIFVQINKHGQYVAQRGPMNAKDLPDPDLAMIMFSTLEDAVKYYEAEADETAYGFTLDLKVPEPKPIGDDYHTMDELYDYRMIYHAHAVLLWTGLGYPVVKSTRHHDGELCFDGGWFIVTANLPTGQVGNHYAVEFWDLFDCEESEKAPEWDGHTPEVARNRLYNFLTQQQYVR